MAIRIISTPSVTAAAAAVDAFQPSLMPTPAVDRGIAAGASWATAALATATIDRMLTSTARRLGLPTALVRGIAIGAGLGATAAMRQRRGESLGIAALRTAGTVVAATAAAGAAGDGAAALRTRAAEAVPGGRAIVTGGVAAAVAAGLGLELRNRLRRFETDGTPTPAPKSVATSLGVAAGMAAATSTLVVGERAVVRRVAGRSRSTVVRAAGMTAGHVVAMGAIAAAAGYGVRTMIAKVEAGNNKVEPAYAAPPLSAAVTGGPGSAVAWDALGHQGRRFLLEASPVERIAEVMGEPARVEPVRVYVGFRNGDSIEERVAIAIEEIRRTEALQRSVVVVASPAGTGYVNYIAAEATEYMARGDSAWISVQYGMRPSLMSFDRLTPGGHHHRALLAAIAAECRATGATPLVAVYGESLGAHTSQNAFLHGGTAVLGELGVDRALYVGTPYRSQWKEQVFRDSRDDVDRTVFARFDSIADLQALTPTERDRLRVFFLDHFNDPVTRFGVDLAVQRPQWLGPPESRPPTVSQTQRWTPLVTFWQTLIDTKNAATVIPGRFDATGHDYRADLAEFVRAAFGFDDVAPRQMEAIEARLRRSEMERADRLASH